MSGFSASELGLRPGDHISFKMEIDRLRSWEWEGQLVKYIPAGTILPIKDVVLYYGTPKQDEDGWYTNPGRRNYERHLEDEEGHREADFATILRRYDNWRCLKVDRVVFQKTNGHYVIMPDPMRCYGRLEVWQTQTTTFTWRIA
jgi:hypothetical protein